LTPIALFRETSHPTSGYNSYSFNVSLIVGLIVSVRETLAA
jgi:hypothetical protein